MGGGPHMFEDDQQGGQGFRQDDSGAGDALAMGMDVDIPAATTAGDRREAERRRGREGRCGFDQTSRACCVKLQLMLYDIHLALGIPAYTCIYLKLF